MSGGNIRGGGGLGRHESNVDSAGVPSSVEYMTDVSADGVHRGFILTKRRTRGDESLPTSPASSPHHLRNVFQCDMWDCDI